MIEILGKKKIDFIAWRRTAFAVSSVLCLLGIVSIIQIARGAANLGIDFAGGTSVQLKFAKPVDIGQIRALLDASGLKRSEPQQFAGGDRILVKLKRAEDSQSGMAQRVQDIFSKGLPDNPFVVEGTNEVGPAIGKDLQKAALWAITISMIGIIVYIAWRFEFKFGVAAASALGLDERLIEPVGMKDVPSQAPRPKDCSLANGKLVRATGFSPTPFAETLVMLKNEF